LVYVIFFFFSSRRRHTRSKRDWSSDVCSSDLIVGFAAETNHPIENGIGKLKKKNLDAIIVNNISTEGAGFEGDTNIVTFINKQRSEERRVGKECRYRRET